jgi:hypothetical protein
MRGGGLTERQCRNRDTSSGGTGAPRHSNQTREQRWQGQLQLNDNAAVSYTTSSHHRMLLHEVTRRPLRSYTDIRENDTPKMIDELDKLEVNGRWRATSDPLLRKTQHCASGRPSVRIAAGFSAARFGSCLGRHCCSVLRARDMSAPCLRTVLRRGPAGSRKPASPGQCYRWIRYRRLTPGAGRASQPWRSRQRPEGSRARLPQL